MPTRIGNMLACGIAALALLAPATASGQSPAGGAPPPAGANDFSCDPPRRHPQPVVLVHGTGGDRSNWNVMSPQLAARGYCVFALNYGNHARGPIQRSARELRRFLERVLDATGAHRVDVVGHSQGGMMPRYYAKFLGGRGTIGDLVGLAASNHGTTVPLAPIFGGGGECPACRQQARGSAFLRNLNHGDETPGPINYTVVATRNDQIVTPYRSAYLHGSPRAVNNVTIQARCPVDQVDHAGIVGDPVAFQWVLNALRQPGPAAESFQPDC